MVALANVNRPHEDVGAAVIEPVKQEVKKVEKALVEPVKKKVTFSNIAVGAAVSLFEVSTLGQPFEVMKTQMAANRTQSLSQAAATVWSRGGVFGLYQGLIPWAWIESATSGAALLFTAAEVEHISQSSFGASPGTAGMLGGISGGVAQAYLSMGFCTNFKTIAITREKAIAQGAASAAKTPSAWATFLDVYRRDGIKGVNRGVNAVAVRQATNWGSRMGFARLAEDMIRRFKRKKATDALSAGDKVLSSSIGGVLGCWNHPIEVVRIEMQSLSKSRSEKRPAKLNMFNTLAYVYGENGIKGLFRGVTPRMALGVWRTVCMVSLADYVRIWVAGRKAAK
ncbi:tricarboxylate carrier [Atractiella rhizophila]|nr:tricarboxylate carrier [Atractiella rhizophila]